MPYKGPEPKHEKESVAHPTGVGVNCEHNDAVTSSAIPPAHIMVGIEDLEMAVTVQSKMGAEGLHKRWLPQKGEPVARDSAH